MELQRKETKEMLDDLTTRDQRMMFGLVTLVHLADSKRQLDSDTETLSRSGASICVSFLRCAGSSATGWTPCCPTVCGASKRCAH